MNARNTAADALGFSPEQVQYTNLALGGGFGRKLPGYSTSSAERPHRQRDVARAVKMIWSRETDMQHATIAPAAWRDSPARSTRRHAARRAIVSTRACDGESVFMAVRDCRTRFSARDAKHPSPDRTVRSLLNSQHGFFKESFIDEMAHAAKKDPFQFRRDLMTACGSRRRRARGGDGRLGSRFRSAKARDRQSPYPWLDRRACRACVGVAGGRAQGETCVCRGGLRRRCQYRHCGGADRGGIIFGYPPRCLAHDHDCARQVVESNFHDFKRGRSWTRRPSRWTCISLARTRRARCTCSAADRVRQWPTRFSPPPEFACASCQSRTAISPCDP